MGNKKTVTVTYSSNDPANPTFAPKGSTDLNEGDTITVKLAGNFPSGSNVNEITIYNNKEVAGVDTKDTSSQVGNWTSANGNGDGLNGIFSCTADSTTQVMIEDTEDNDDDIKYWYSAYGVIGGTTNTWSIDPELINKGKS